MASRRKTPGDALARLLLGAGSLLCLACPQLLSDEFTLQADGEPRLSGDPITLDASRDPEGIGAGGSSASPDPSTLLAPDDPDAPGSPDAGGPDDPDNPDTPPEPDGGSVVVSQPGPPAVLNVSPSDGATGVLSDAVVTLTFSEAMNTNSVELAYSSFDLPADAVSFSWTAGDTVLHITPDEPLTIATGTSAAATFATPYAFEIGSTALDQDGSPLPSFSSGFSVVREITQTWGPIFNRSLTGNYRADNSYGTGECEQQDTAVCVGDSSAGNSAYRGFLTFDLSDIPATAADATAASLNLLITSEVGGPFSTLGSLGVERVTFDSIGSTVFSASPLGALAPISHQNDLLSANVLAAVRTDFSGRARSQFRLRFSTASDQDGTADFIASEWTTVELEITYLIP